MSPDVAQPNGAYATTGDESAALAQLIAHPSLAVCRLLNGKLHHSLFDSWVNTIFQDRLPTTDLHQGGFAALVVQLLETVKTVPAKSHDLAGLRYAVELLSKPKQAHLVLYHFALLCNIHLTFLPLANPARISKCQIKS